MGYGIGSSVIPLLSAPFLDPEISRKVHLVKNSYIPELTTPGDTQVGNTSALNINTTLTKHHIAKYPANFTNVYWILAAFSLTLSLIFVMYYIYGLVYNVHIESTKPAKLLTFKESLSPRSCSPLKPTYAAMILVSLFFYKAIGFSLIRGFSKYLYTYARNGSGLSVEDATALESAFFVCVMVGRFAGFCAATVVHVKYILQVSIAKVVVYQDSLAFLRSKIVSFAFSLNHMDR